jgi:uncharacterized protein YkwD
LGWRRTALALGVVASVMAMPDLASASPTASERKLYSMIANARSDRGMSALGRSDELSGVARRHSARMAEQGFLFHTPCLTCRIDVGNVLAENVGVGSTVRQVHRMLMRSAGHRANILGGFSRVGVGVVKRGARIWVTEIFAA